MNENYLSGIGAGLILVSFGVILSFFVVTGIETTASEENQTISFEQLRELNVNTPAKLKNTTVVQEFRQIVGETVEDLKDRVVLENSTLLSEIQNTTNVTGLN